MRNRITVSLVCVMLAVIIAVFILTHLVTRLKLSESSFDQLPGWNQSNLVPSFKAFKRSCHFFLSPLPRSLHLQPALN